MRVVSGVWFLLRANRPFRHVCIANKKRIYVKFFFYRSLRVFLTGLSCRHNQLYSHRRHRGVVYGGGGRERVVRRCRTERKVRYTRCFLCLKKPSWTTTIVCKTKLLQVVCRTWCVVIDAFEKRREKHTAGESRSSPHLRRRDLLVTVVLRVRVFRSTLSDRFPFRRYYKLWYNIVVDTTRTVLRTS